MKTAIAVILSCIYTLSFGQASDLHVDGFGYQNKLDSVRVNARRTRDAREAISATLVKANPSQNFAELLQKQSGIYIRSRGSGVLSTPSFKGLGTQQTPILINGANMQSSMNGTMDLSLIDAAHFTQIEIGKAGLNTTGQQNIGDAIQLSSRSGQHCLYGGLSTSTHKDISANAKFVTGNEKWTFNISGIATQSKNIVDLSHYDLGDSAQENTDFKRASILQTVDVKLKKGTWNNTVYLQKSERGVPPPFFQSNNSRQADANAMVINKLKIYLKYGFLVEAVSQVWAEQIVFNNALSNEETDSRVLNVNTVLSASKYFGNRWLGKVGVSYDAASYTSEALDGNAEWRRPRLFVNVKKNCRTTVFSLTQNILWYKEKQAYNGEFRVSGDIAKRHHCTASVQRIFRLPVLNELYWYMPGQALGNPNLKPEEGYKADLSWTRYGKILTLTLNPHAGIYENWVQWSGMIVTRPENIQNVMVYGAVANANHLKSFNNVKLMTQVNLHWVNALYKFESANDSRHEKQLIYTPRFTGNLTFTIVHQNYGLYTNLQAVGTNYVATDNSISIKPYQLVEFGGYYEWKTLRIGGVVSNLLNIPYFSQPRTPLPGRIIKLNLNYKILSKKI
ncbi:TonB-dependent receptor [Bacteroidia bacterium]|nr:TonB-dependent receptor [Bacteroidia bacterium]